MYAARSTSTKEKKLTSPPSRRSFAKRSPSTVLASRKLRRKRSLKLQLLDVGLHDLADERSPRHVESAVNGAGQRTGVVLEDLDHQRSVVGENHAGLLHAEQARLTLRADRELTQRLFAQIIRRIEQLAWHPT